MGNDPLASFVVSRPLVTVITAIRVGAYSIHCLINLAFLICPIYTNHIVLQSFNLRNLRSLTDHGKPNILPPSRFNSEHLNQFKYVNGFRIAVLFMIYSHEIKLIVIHLDFHSAKRALWLVDSWSRAPDQIQAPSTRIRIFLNPQLFLSGYGYRPHAYGEFASKSGNFWIRSSEWKFLNPITFRIRVDGRIRIFSDTMTSQNWRKCLPRKFKYGCRSKAKSFCAPWAYFQSFSLYAAKCRSTKCWNKLCQKAARHHSASSLRYLPDKTADRNNLNE